MSLADQLLEATSSPLEERGYDGKFVGKDVRVQWSDYHFLVEELPQKGKKKLRRAELRNPGWNFFHDMGELIPQNLLRDAKLSKGDNYDAVLKKLSKAMRDAIEYKGEPRRTPEQLAKKQKIVGGYGNWKPWENEVYFLHVVPEGVEPITIKGKDFNVNAKWNEFSAYSPQSDDRGGHDPHYSYYGQKSDGAARKLYKTLKANPDAIRNISWMEFSTWMDKKKIGYKMHHSVWH